MGRGQPALRGDLATQDGDSFTPGTPHAPIKSVSGSEERQF